VSTIYQRREMRIAARDIDELCLIVEDCIWIVRHRNAFDQEHCRWIEDIDGIRFAARYKGKVTRGFDDDSVRHWLPRQSRYIAAEAKNLCGF